VGARFDALAYESHSRLFFTPTPRARVGLVSPKVAASYRIAPRLVLSASLSRGFRGAPGVIHKPDQPPMMVRAAEIGVRFLAGRVVADLAAFRLDIGHERIRDPVTRDVSDAGESVRQGLTAHAEIRLTQDVDAFVRGTWNDARMSRSVDPTPHVVRWSVSGDARLAPSAHEIHRDPLEPGDRVPGVSQYLGSMGFEAMLGSIKLRTTWRFNGPFTPIGEPDITTTRYLLLDFIAAMPLTPTLAINAELINAFNTLYPEVRAYGYVNPGVLRTVRLTLTYVGAPTRSGHRPSPETPSE
jgi:outer membrane receptor protein involved in Fe transport